MAEQKFLGQAGTDVLVEKINITAYDKFINQLQKIKQQILPYVDANDEDIPAEIVAIGQMFYSFYVQFEKTYLASMYPKQMGFPTFLEYASDFNFDRADTIIDGIIDYCENTTEESGIKYGDVLRTMPDAYFNSMLAQTNLSNIQEITADEVTAKFNS